MKFVWPFLLGWVGIAPTPPLTQRIRRYLEELIGLHLRYLMSERDRMRRLHLSAWLAVAIGLAFATYHLLLPEMALLGRIHLLAVLCLLLPSALLAPRPGWIDLAEGLMLAAVLVIFGALIVQGGVEGTGLFWACMAPFLAFFIKGQKRGWYYSLVFLALVLAYLVSMDPGRAFAYAYPPATRLHFLLSLGFYTLAAAHFNLLHNRFEHKLARRLMGKSAQAKDLAAQMALLATHDATTGLPNRTHMLALLQQEISSANGQRLAVCHLRLERLLELGNVLGLSGADHVIAQVATQLAQITDGHGVLAHGRRDEFIISYRLAGTGVDAEALGRFLARQQMAVQDQGVSLHVELTLGLAICPEHGQQAEVLLKSAEQAMLQARKNALRWFVYDAQQEQHFMHHHLLFGKLRDALQHRQLTLHYQPQIDLPSGRVVGAEALVRWPDAAEGMISPSVFIAVAEESGLIRPLMIWVVSEAIRACERWHRLGLMLNVSVNLSALNLHDPELPDALQAALTETGLHPRYVTLEITESCLMTSPERATAMLQGLHESGFNLSIDNFGTGYSSLAYLKNLPVNELKIDRSFVTNLLDQPGDQAIVASTIALAHNFKLRVVAQGIENEATADWFKAQGCDRSQGYHYAHPMPPPEFVEFVKGRTAQPNPDWLLID